MPAAVNVQRQHPNNLFNFMAEMRREFADREDLLAYLREQFPAAAARDNAVSTTRGGRRAAETQLRQLDPTRYEKTRNYLDGAVSRLAPYLRHGVLSLAEVRDFVLARIGRGKNNNKFINELGWRDYYQRFYAQRGAAIWQDLEAYKTGFQRKHYAADLPSDIEQGRTDLACMDAFSQELQETGYLHNHARMWVAAYVVHWRRVQWQAGARWFLRHLLDGDPASNNLSWQWIASTFSNKPYIFNRDNLEKFTDAQYCRRCPQRGHCAFEGEYHELSEQLFPQLPELFVK